MKKYTIIIAVLLLAGFWNSCDDFLNRDPQNILPTETVWSNPDLIAGNLGNLYNRMPEFQNLEEYWNFTVFQLGYPSRYVDYWRLKNTTYPYNKWSYWDYNLIHDINLFLINVKKAEDINDDVQERFIAEAHYLRAQVYFELVKRVGGVPILTDTLYYNFDGEPSNLYHARDSEADVYDFILAELDSALLGLPNDPSIKTRATWGAALAMKSRAALFAGSIANHGTTTPTVSLPEGEVGIPANRADHYYQIALDAAQKIIESGRYSLYMEYPDDLQKNFAQIFLDESSNPEAIFVDDYLSQNQTQQFTVNNQPRSLTEEAASSGFLNPTLNLVQMYEIIDGNEGKYAPLAIKNPATNEYIKYDEIGDIFKNRDARLGGTVILPGSKFKNQNVDIWAGYVMPDGSTVSGSSFGAIKTLPGTDTPRQVVGKDGPIDQIELGTQTGFFIRKYLDPDPEGGRIGTGSDVWWIEYRYAEVLLNAAEAAFALDMNGLSAKYLNKIRARAGFTNDLEASDITFDRIVHARIVELAFEGHFFWDMKRWRLAHVVWNGQKVELTEEPGNMRAPRTRPWGLWPYKIFDPSTPNDGDVQWIFKKVIPSPVTAAINFRLGNYYSEISPSVLANNPKLIQNPNQ